jgi:hypothetical protein
VDIGENVVWSSRRPPSRVTRFELLQADPRDIDLEYVINERYTDYLRQLAVHARLNTSATSEPAYRMLQVLTHLREGAFAL